MAYTQLIPQEINGGNAEQPSAGDKSNAYRLSLPVGPSGKYRLAQLYDYAKLPRGRFPWRPPVTLRLSARASSSTIPGTWGFGVWNDPFGLSLGFGGTGWRLPSLPNAAWFFHASEENYLSFRDDRPAQGFLAQVFRSPGFHPGLIPAGLALPFSRRLTRKWMAKVIGENGERLHVDVTEWHGYRLDWRQNGVTFRVDDVPVLEASLSPRSPLGLVIWIDNQYAAFTPQGKIGFGVLENPEPAWLEIKDLELTGG